MSAPINLTLSIDTPKAVAKIWAMTVLAPCPISIAPWCKTTVPSARIPDFIVEGFGSEVFPHPYQPLAMPTPRLKTVFAALKVAQFSFSCDHAGRSALKHFVIPTPCENTWPQTVGILFFKALMMRNSSGSISNFWASSSNRHSWAIAD